MAHKKVTIDLNGGDAVTANGDLLFQLHDGGTDAILAECTYAKLGSENAAGSDVSVTINITGDVAVLDHVDIGAATSLKYRVKDEAGNESVLSAAKDITVESWDISAATYDSISKDISSEITVDSNCGLVVNPAKTKLIISSHLNEKLYQYTINGDGTLTYDSVSFDYSTHLAGALPYGLAISHDGSHLLMTDYTANLHVFDLPTAGTLTGMSYDQAVNLSANSDARAVTLNADSTKVFIADTTGDDVDRYSIDLTAGTIVATYDTGQNYGLTPTSTVSRCILLANAGTKIYLSDGDNENIREFTLSTADDLTTITDEASPLDLTAWGDTVIGGAWTDGIDLYIVGGSTQTIRKYSM